MGTILKALKHNFAVGDTSYTFSDSNITDNAIIDVYFTKDVSYECSQTGNAVTVEIPAQTSVVGCAIVINNVDSVDYPITANDVSYFDSTVYTELLEHESEINSLGVAVGVLDETKQNNLTAGDNITIENNIISASGGGSVNIFSDVEVLWGKVKENGVERNVYHKYITIPTTGGRHTATFTIENIDTLIKWEGYINPPAFTTHFAIGDGAYFCQIFSVSTSNVDYFMANNLPNAGIKLFLYYTKVGE